MRCTPVALRRETTLTRLLTIPEAAERLALKPSTVRKLIALQQIPAVRPTKRAVRLRESDIELLIRVGYRDNAQAGR